MSGDVDVAELRRDVAAAIAGALAGHEQSLVTRWVAIVESVDVNTGERGVWCLAPDDAKAWDTVGLLRYALFIEQAVTTANAVHASPTEEGE